MTAPACGFRCPMSSWDISSRSPLTRSCLPTIVSPSPPYSLDPPHFHRAALYSRVSIATLADMQRVSVSRGTRLSPLPLAVASTPGGAPIGRLGTSWLMVFTGMRS